MSKQYNEYIKDHKDNVHKAFQWLQENISFKKIFGEHFLEADCMWLCTYKHDDSKYSNEEYDAYDAYFYGGNRSYEVVENFNKAWLHHIHENPHHWQHWILINDDPENGEKILDMPDVYIVEMVCDWLSFSIAKGKMGEIFEWYDKHSKYMRLSDYTRLKVEELLDDIESALSGEKTNE